MAYRVVLIENDMDLKIQLGRIVFCKEEGDIRIPLDDISTIVMDNLCNTITTRTLCQLAQNNIVFIICDQEHLPIGMFSSYDNHSRMSKKIKNQINKNEEYYGVLWQNIVRAKINNQAKTLALIEKVNDESEKLLEYCKDIEVDDKTNREAHAAKLYFNKMMDNTYSRGNNDIILNSALDYGYTIVRSYIARLCVGYGLNTQLGIHHKNEFNRFNLCDDLIEPVRPILDLFAYRMMKGEEYLTREHRHSLINFLNHKIRYKNKKMYVASMLEEYISSYAAYLEGNIESMAYPCVDDYIGEKDEV